jgi:hypothetical protein
MSKITNANLRQVLKAEINKLKKLDKACRKRRVRDWMHPFLSAVMKLYVDLGKRITRRKARSILVKKVEPPKGGDRHLIRLIIDATSKENDKKCSRATQALLYARKHRRQWDDLPRFIKENGGIAGCATRLARERRKKLVKQEEQSDRSW